MIFITLLFSFGTTSVLAQNIGIDSNQVDVSNSIKDSTGNNVPNSSINIMNNENKWINVSGSWALDESGLHGGTSMNGSALPTNVLLNPDKRENLSSIFTTFRINEINPENSNYVSIIYQFQNPDVYSYGGINVLDNKIYTLFWNMNNGILEAYPSWPGVETDFAFAPNSLFNLSIVRSPGGVELLLNDSSLYHLKNKSNSNPEYIGLHYGNINNITFFDFGSKSEQPYPTSDIQTIRLNDKELPENDYILLYDSSPFLITKAMIEGTLPCNEDNSTDITVLQGNETTYDEVKLNFISSISLESDQCNYEGTIQHNLTNPTNKIFLLNNSTDEIEFSNNNVVFVKVQEILRNIN